MIDWYAAGFGRIAELILSRKSMDLLESYQVQRSLQTLKRYVDKLGDFTVARRKGVRIQAGPSTERILEVIVQTGAARPWQLSEMAQAAAYAQSQGVKLVVREFP